MILQTNQSMNHPILQRPRLNALIHEGLKHPLLVVLAAPGYGKTQAMVDYVQACDAEVLWLHFNAIDNLPDRFWARLTRMIRDRYPELAERLRQVAFPDNIRGFAVFAQMMEERVCTGKPVIWVFDDYGIIENQQIKRFIHLLVDAGLSNFHLVLLSNGINSTDTIAFMTTRRALLLADELRFDEGEIRALYHLYGIKLSAGELEAVERYTEGWPLPLCLLAAQHDRISALMRGGEGLTPRVISLLFEERFFAAYTEHQQKLMVKLSMMDSFTKSFAFGLYEGESVELLQLENHSFMINEPASDRFYLHHLYRSFLQQRSYLLTPEDERSFWQRVAEYHMASGDALEAIPCYCKCGDHKNMLDAMKRTVASQVAITDKMAAYLMSYLDLLTAEELQRYPVADCIRAMIYTFTYRLDSAEALVIDLEGRLSKARTAEARSLLGEVFITHGLIRMLGARDDFGQYFRKAAGLLCDASELYNPGDMKVCNYFSFFMPDNLPGAKERIERAVQSGVPWISRVMAGSMSGMPQLFSAEGAYLSNHLEEAKQHAYRAIYEAEARAQHDLVLNAYCILIRIEFALGNFREMTKHMGSLDEYARRFEQRGIHEIRETALAWYYIKMRDYKRISKSALVPDGADRAMISYGRIYIVYANSLIGIGEYAKLVGLLEHLKHTLPFQSITEESIYLYVMLATGYHCLGNREAAMDALWVAYDMCHANGLVMLFVEADEYMLALIAAARQQHKHRFSAQWLDQIERETTAFIRRAEAVRAAYRRKNPSRAVKDNPLSKRELAVLQAVARGLTREEIALEQYISMNTVKSTITSIFNKLGASNKAAAVSIALTKGYIDGYTPKY